MPKCILRQKNICQHLSYFNTLCLNVSIKNSKKCTVLWWEMSSSTSTRQNRDSTRIGTTNQLLLCTHTRRLLTLNRDERRAAGSICLNIDTSSVTSWDTSWIHTGVRPNVILVWLPSRWWCLPQVCSVVLYSGALGLCHAESSSLSSSSSFVPLFVQAVQ